ncbi:MAG: glycogen-binding domain-containing protein [Bacteroidetes bacterium]|nr:glycogen-binding domain-containing protein [Bacteroidota bacterium]
MGNINSVITLGDPYNFTLKGYQNANAVVLAGSFNNWNAGELIMQKTETGWQLPFVLAPGNYEYKFIVDGNWITDPANPVTTKLGETINSFIVISANHLFTLSAFPLQKKCISPEVFADGLNLVIKCITTMEYGNFLLPACRQIHL